MLTPLARASLAVLSSVTLLAGLARADATPTRLTGGPGQWQLTRAGQPYFIKGVGGSGSLALLKELGGNSVRTWGADDLGQQLDEAQRLGISVCVGLWLGHEDRINNFNYDDPAQVAKQFAKAKAAIDQYKDHPAVLMWGVGNEMEGPTGEKASIWKAVNDIAAYAKKVDPNHPTMTVIAEIGGDAVKVKNLAKHCPAIDVIGINSYGGAASVAKRYADSGVTKPYVLTEYGPIGFWEGGKTPYGAPIEPTSTQKVDMYESAYHNAIGGNRGTALGGYAFLWGWKQETTATWFGLMLEDGTLTPAVDAVAASWGTPRTPTALRIEPVRLDGPDTVPPGGTVKASVEASGAKSVHWELHRETEVHGEGGSFEAKTAQYADAVKPGDAGTVTVTMPAKPGVYRLYAIARDGGKYAATANVPLRVRAAEAGGPGLKKAVVLVGDNAPESGYVPSGWMGKADAIALDPKSTAVKAHTGPTSLECKYTAPGDFGGVVWQSPANNWGTTDGGRSLTGAKRLAFWARGATGGETVEFKFGILNTDQAFKDTASGQTAVTLTPQWTRYTIDLAGKDLSKILTGFCWTAAGQGKPITFYLDDVAFE